MKRGVITFVILLGIIAALWLRRDPEPETQFPHPTPTPRVAPPVPPPLPDKPVLPHPVAAEAEKLNASDQSTDDDMAILIILLEEYRRHFDENPVGDNSEITAALSGRNQKRIAFLPNAPAAYINSAGELIDRWGSPYFFHAISGTQMEIQSAGPDREWHTADDVHGTL